MRWRYSIKGSDTTRLLEICCCYKNSAANSKDERCSASLFSQKQRYALTEILVHTNARSHQPALRWFRAHPFLVPGYADDEDRLIDARARARRVL